MRTFRKIFFRLVSFRLFAYAYNFLEKLGFERLKVVVFCSFSRSFWLELFFVSILYLSLDGIQVPFLSPKLRTFTDDDSLVVCMYMFCEEFLFLCVAPLLLSTTARYFTKAYDYDAGNPFKNVGIHHSRRTFFLNERLAPCTYRFHHFTIVVSLLCN